VSETKANTSDLLTWAHLKRLGRSDNGNRWYPDARAPAWVHAYLKRFRPPSRQFPWSLARALLTRKFLDHARTVDPDWVATLTDQ